METTFQFSAKRISEHAIEFTVAADGHEPLVIECDTTRLAAAFLAGYVRACIDNPTDVETRNREFLAWCKESGEPITDRKPREVRFVDELGNVDLPFTPTELNKSRAITWAMNYLQEAAASGDKSAASIDHATPHL